MWPIFSKASTSSSVTMDSAARFMINSFVFLDLETSHLVSSDRPTIIEMSLFAVHRTGLLHPDVLTSVNRARNEDATYDLSRISFPRVVDKLTLCLDPRKHTSPETFWLTKLDNLNLGESKKMKLDEDVISMLKIFLSRQESPICLVAHNGNKFDYPMLRTELSRLTEEEPFIDLYCADSWVGFRDDFATARETIFSNTETFSLKRKLPNCETSRGSFPQKRGLDESSPSPESNGVGSSSEDASIAAVSGSNSTTTCSTLASSSSSIQPQISGGSGAQELVPLPSNTIENHACNSLANVPQEHSTSADNIPCCSSDNTPQHKSTSAENNPYDTSDTTSQRTFSKRPSPPPPPRKTNQQYHSSGGKSQKISYSLINIFKRTFGREPLNSHSAEDDVASLINILLPRVEEFVNWADMNATQYKDVELYYKPRKTRRKLFDE